MVAFSCLHKRIY